MIRKAVEKDMVHLEAIYDQAIFSPNIEAPDFESIGLERRIQWFRQREDYHPIFVWEEAKEVLGFSFIGPLVFRPHWRHVSQVAVFLDHSVRSQWVGAKLFTHLIWVGKQLEYQSLVATVLTENLASMRAVTRLYHDQGVFSEIAWLNEHWCDIRLFQRSIPSSADSEVFLFLKRFWHEIAEDARYSGDFS